MSRENDNTLPEQEAMEGDGQSRSVEQDNEGSSNVQPSAKDDNIPCARNITFNIRPPPPKEKKLVVKVTKVTSNKKKRGGSQKKRRKRDQQEAEGEERVSRNNHRQREAGGSRRRRIGVVSQEDDSKRKPGRTKNTQEEAKRVSRVRRRFEAMENTTQVRSSRITRSKFRQLKNQWEEVEKYAGGLPLPQVWKDEHPSLFLPWPSSTTDDSPQDPWTDSAEGACSLAKEGRVSPQLNHEIEETRILEGEVMNSRMTRSRFQRLKRKWEQMERELGGLPLPQDWRDENQRSDPP